jgi:RNA 2',3'-cyclic 3'-phosphodiesterase
LRLFFALWPDSATGIRIALAAQALRLDGKARLVPQENFHITLAFVGEVDTARLAVLQQIGRDQRGLRSALCIDAYEHWAEPRVVVAVARETPPELTDLCASLRQALDRRAEPLRAHVTLARKVTQAPVLQAMSPILWAARSFSLVRSETGGARSVYTVVDTWPLLDKHPTT